MQGGRRGESTVVAAGALGKAGDVEGVEESEGRGFPGGASGGDGDVSVTADMIVNARDYAEGVAEGELDEVKRYRRVMPVGTGINRP